MDNPYQPKPGTFEAHRRRVNEEALITLKDDSARPPATVGPGWQSLIMGASARQPSKASRDIKPGWGKRVYRVFFWTWGALVVLAAVLKVAALLRG